MTFNDTSANPFVSIVGTVTPTLVTESAAENYVITGSGNIAGTASLVMSGSGTLSISNANSYTGGITISSGKVLDGEASQLALGTGLITLAGGTLEMGVLLGVATVGLTNINVTGNSTLQFDGGRVVGLERAWHVDWISGGHSHGGLQLERKFNAGSGSSLFAFHQQRAHRHLHLWR